MNDGPQLGQIIEDGERRRDAIHIAVAPVVAAQRLTPGEHVGLIREGDRELVGPCDENLGIVDPFLTGDVEPGQRFWLFLGISGLTRRSRRPRRRSGRNRDERARGLSQRAGRK